MSVGWGQNRSPGPPERKPSAFPLPCWAVHSPGPRRQEPLGSPLLDTQLTMHSRLLPSLNVQQCAAITVTSDLLPGGQASAVRLIFGRPEHSPAQWTPCSTPRGAGSGFPVADPTASCTSTTPSPRGAVFSLQRPRAEARGSQGPSVPKRHTHVHDRERSWRGELSSRLQSPVVLS